MDFASHVLELPDYNIQQVEQAEYQQPIAFGEMSKSLFKKPLVWIALLAIMGLVYRSLP